MFLTGNPSEEYTETTRKKRIETFESFSQEASSRRVLFDTGKVDVTPWQSDLLNEYLYAIVVRSGL